MNRGYYGFQFPKGYDPKTPGKYVFTKFNPGLNNYTTGNWLPTWDWHILPVLDLDPPKPSPPKGVDQEQNDEYISRISSETAQLLVYLDQWKSVYIPNILGYGDPNTFSPELKGFNWFKVEREAFYTICGKWFLY